MWGRVARLVLVGASLGGMAVAKRAAALAAAAVVIVGAPPGRSAFALRVSDAEMAAVTAPKLFVVSADDANVPPAQTRPVRQFEAPAQGSLAERRGVQRFVDRSQKSVRRQGAIRPGSQAPSAAVQAVHVPGQPSPMRAQ